MVERRQSVSPALHSSARGRVVVVGAGVGGLACAIDLARSGHEVLVLESAAQPGGKLREVRIGSHAARCRPDRVHDALGVRRAVRRRRHDARRTPRAAAARHCWRAMPGVPTSGSTCSPMSSGRPMPSAASPVLPKRGASSRSANAPAPCIARWRRRSCAARDRRRCRWRHAPAGAACPTCGGSRRSRRSGRASAITSTIRGCASCSGATRPTAARRRSRHRRR